MSSQGYWPEGRGKFSFRYPFITLFIVAYFPLFFFVQPPWTQAADMLFKQGAACEQYKQPQKIYDFKNIRWRQQ